MSTDSVSSGRADNGGPHARQPLLVMDGGPERTLRVGRPGTGDDPAEVSATMVTGPWLNGPADAVPGGALGVLVDNALAHVLLRNRRADRWSVSAEISVDLCAPVPADGTPLTVRARMTHFGERGGLATGTVRDPGGSVIATCSQHTRWIPSPFNPDDVEAFFKARMAEPVQGKTPAEVYAEGGPASLTELLDARVRVADGCAVLEVPATKELCNPLGNMHGGITFCAVDLAAQAALRSVGGPVHTGSVHVAYPRPVAPGTTARFEAQVIHSGRSLGLVRVTALNEAGRPCVVASVTTGQVPF